MTKTEIDEAVRRLLQPAEELEGPTGDDYIALMEAVAAEAKSRIENYRAYLAREH